MRKNYTKTYHIIFDAFGVDPKLLNSEEFAVKILLKVPKLIGMKILSGPNLVRDYDKRHGGVTGFCIVNFSHVSLHTFVVTREIFIDVFSCKVFDQKKIREYLKKELGVKPEQIETLEVKYPWEN